MLDRAKRSPISTKSVEKNKMAALFSPNIDASDEEYLVLRDDPGFKAAKQFLEQLWEKYEPYADKDFRKQIALDFHPRFWEMYLTCSLLDQKHELLPKKSRKGPDVCLINNNFRIWIEAVAPGAGKGEDAVPQPKIELNRVEVNCVPDAQIILRFTSVIDYKHSRYLKYLDEKVVDPAESYVIAINGRKVLFPRPDDTDLPFIVQALLPLGNQTITINTTTSQIVHEGFSYRPHIKKKSGESISTRIFLDEEHSGISGILFSNADILNLPRKSGQEFIFVHNPKATNPLPPGWLKIGHEFWLEGDKLFRTAWK